MNGVYLLTMFLAAFGMLFLWLSYRALSPTRKGLRLLVEPKAAFLLFGLFYLGLSHFTLFIGLGVEVEYPSGCEYLINQSIDVDNGGGSYTHTYTYLDPCVSPPGVILAVDIFGWLLWLDLLALLIALGILTGAWVISW